MKFFVRGLVSFCFGASVLNSIAQETSSFKNLNGTPVISKKVQTISFYESGCIKTIAGTGEPGYSGDGEVALVAQLNFPQGIVADKDGNLYVADYKNNVVRKIEKRNGIISTIAGLGIAGFSGDGGLAANARFHGPTGLAMDSRGDLYISDSFNNRIRKVSLTTGIISTVAGKSETVGYGGDGGPATAALLNWPRGIAVDRRGNLYIADNNNHRIRKVTPDGIITTLAGTGERGYNGDNIPALRARLLFPSGVAVDDNGSVYVADNNNRRVRKVDSAGIISTFAGEKNTIGSYDAAARSGIFPVSVSVGRGGKVYIADELNNNVITVSQSTGLIETVAGIGPGEEGMPQYAGYPADARLVWPDAVYADTSGNVYISDSGNNTVKGVFFNELPDKQIGDNSFELVATSSAGLPLTFTSSNPAVASVKGNIVTLVGIGQTQITATQEGSENYYPAKPVSKTLNVMPLKSQPIVVNDIDGRMLMYLVRFTRDPLKMSVTAGLMMAGLVWAASRRRYKKKLTQLQLQARLRAEKERIAQDLHDNIGSHLTSINFSLSQLAKGGRLADDKYQALTQSIHSTILELRNTIWAINKDSVSIAELIDKVNNFLWRLSRSVEDVRFEMIPLNEDKELNPSQAINIFRIIQEAINNSLKHANPTKVTISFSRGLPNHLIVKIIDDGRGFVVNNKPSGEQYGLQGMYKRASEIQGELNIKSSSESGTLVQLIFELNSISS